jgi:hypothetical protein
MWVQEIDFQRCVATPALLFLSEIRSAGFTQGYCAGIHNNIERAIEKSGRFIFKITQYDKKHQKGSNAIVV